jgi:NAD-dependent dihydropyrimidine dehydrogenase PreA subunit
MTESVYSHLWKKLHEGAQTAPTDPQGNPQPSFIKYLELTYTPEEAELLQHMGRPGQFSATRDLAGIVDKPVEDVEAILGRVHKKNGILGMPGFYTLPPVPILFNKNMFYPEVKAGDLEAAELYQDYFIKDKFYRYYEASMKGTPAMRTIPVEMSLEAQQKVLPAEEAHDFILTHAPEELTLVPCPCRTRTEKMGVRECKDKFPIGTCIMMGPAALHFEMLELGKRVTRQEAVEYFDKMQEKGLVGLSDNAISENSIICLCCGCCCSQLRGRTRWDNPDAILSSNFLPAAGDDCIGCGLCTERCLLEALTMDDETDRPVVDADKCIGCGVCALTCPQETLELYRHERSTPCNTGRELFKTIALENRE